jgi:hypothetical protein
MSGGLLLGRTTATLNPEAISGDTGKLFAAQLLDEATAEGVIFEHCTFANVSFKDAALARCLFRNCAFVDCYFRDTKFTNCKFEVCKFEDCKFVRPHFVDSTFLFPEFRGCYIPFKSFYASLPVDAGFRHAIADELARESGTAGELGDARRYRLVGEEAFERHQWNLAWASGGEYYEKPRPPRDRVEAGVRWAGRKFNRHLWGYGERGVILARSFLVVAVILFPFLYWLLSRDELSYRGEPLSLWNYVLFSIDRILAAAGFSQVVVSGTLVRWLSGIEVFVGLILIGLFISLIFNWIRRR